MQTRTQTGPRTRPSRRHIERGALIWTLIIAGWISYLAGAVILIVGLVSDSWRTALIGVAVLVVGLVIDLRRFTRVSHRRQVQIMGMIFDKTPSE